MIIGFKIKIVGIDRINNAKKYILLFLANPSLSIILELSAVPIHIVICENMIKNKILFSFIVSHNTEKNRELYKVISDILLTKK